MSGSATSSGLTRREFARHVGCSHTVINKLVARGLIPVDASGQIPLLAGTRAYASVRPAPAPGASEPAATERAAPVEPGAPNDNLVTGGRAEAELERIRWQAKLAQLKARKEAGELVERTAVQKDASDTCSAIRTALLAVPPRLARLIEGLCAGGPPRVSEIQQVLEDEVNAVLEHLHGSRFTGGADDLA